MKLTQKQLILIVGIGTLIIASGLVGVAWYYSEQKAETTNQITNTNENEITLVSTIDISSWKTYTNDVWGFSFKYPDTWDIIEDNLPIYIPDRLHSQQNEYLLIGVKDKDKQVPEEYVQLWISPDGWWPISAGKNHMGIDKKFEINKKDNHFVVTAIQNDGFEADEDSAESYLVSVFDTANQGEKKFVIYYGSAPDQANNLDQITNASIPSYTFFEPTNEPAIDSSNWKTYTNANIGIEFKYPADWPDIDDQVGDIMRNGKIYTSFSIHLIDNSLLSHTFLDYDNATLDEQIRVINCEWLLNYKSCKQMTSEYGVKYYIRVANELGAETHGALVATGKYILAFNFAESENYEKRANEYQTLLWSLKIIPSTTDNADSFFKEIGSTGLQGKPLDITYDNGYVYVAEEDTSIEIFSVEDPEQPKLVSTIPESGIEFYDSTRIRSGVYIKDSKAFIVDSALRIVDVSDPANPELIATLSQPLNLEAHGLALYDHYAYVVVGENSAKKLLQLDISKLPEMKSNTFDFLYNRANGSFIQDGGRLYFTNAHGFDVVDVSNATKPQWVTYYSKFGLLVKYMLGPGGFHLIEWPETKNGGYDRDALGTILDVSDPNNIREVDTYPASFLFASGQTGYDDIIFDDNKAYITRGDRIDAYNVEDLHSPKPLGSISGSGITRIAKNDRIIYTASDDGAGYELLVYKMPE